MFPTLEQRHAPELEQSSELLDVLGDEDPVLAVRKFVFDQFEFVEIDSEQTQEKEYFISGSLNDELESEDPRVEQDEELVARTDETEVYHDGDPCGSAHLRI